MSSEFPFPVIDRPSDFIDVLNRHREFFDLPQKENSSVPLASKFQSSPSGLGHLPTLSGQPNAARFAETISISVTSSHTPSKFNWVAGGILLAGAAVAIGLGGGLPAFAGWRLGTLAISALVLLACNPYGGTVNPEPTMKNDAGVKDGGMVDLTSFADLQTIPTGVKSFAYIPNFDNGEVTVIDTSTDRVEPFSIGTGKQSFGIAVTSKKAYVTSSREGTLYVIDTSVIPRRVVSVISRSLLCSEGGSPGYIAVTPNEKKAYVGCRTLGSAICNEVDVVDTATNRITPILSIGGSSAAGDCMGAIDVSPDSRNVYVTHQYHGLVVIDSSTDMVVSTIPEVRSDAYGGGVAVTSDSKKVYVTESDGTISVIDTATKKRIRTIPVGGAAGVVVTDFQLGPDLPWVS